MPIRLLLTMLSLGLLCSACGFQLREDAELPPEMAQTRMVIEDENSTLARRVLGNSLETSRRTDDSISSTS